MRAETQGNVEAIEKTLKLLAQRMDWETAPHRLEEFDAMIESPDLWNDPAKAQKLMRDRQGLMDAVAGYKLISGGLKDNVELIELGEMEGDTEIVTEAERALSDLVKVAAEKELEALLDGEADGNDTFLEINAGAGGTESCDWASMLARMYVRWAEKRGFTVELQSESEGDGAGIKSASYKISGKNAYGWLKTEAGVHRLVRISPYDSAARRHTSFCSVWVYPVVDDNIEIEVQDKDIRIDTYRSSGAGGQHVNVTDSAVRITHLPTGIVTSCQNERSQHQNKDRALSILAAKLADLARQERAAELAAIAGETQKVEWGSQIRSYFVHPEQRVKDHRTNFESGNVEGVFDGDLTPFMEAYLRWRRVDAASS